MGTILTARTINWFHGHYRSNQGVVFYGDGKTYDKSVGVLTNWLVTCGKNSGSIPNNILIDGVAAGTAAEGSGNSVLCINLISNPVDVSDWAFRELMIWNTALSDAEMLAASTALRVSLLYGQV